MKRIAAVLMSISLGVQISIGYIAVSILFTYLDRIIAGQLAGELFHVVHYLSLFTWIIALIAMGRTSAWEYNTKNKPTKKWIIVLLILFTTSEFLLSPTIAAFKINQTSLLTSWFGGDLKTWHGISSTIYLIETVLSLSITSKSLRLSH